MRYAAHLKPILFHSAELSINLGEVQQQTAAPAIPAAIKIIPSIKGVIADMADNWQILNYEMSSPNTMLGRQHENFMIMQSWVHQYFLAQLQHLHQYTFNQLTIDSTLPAQAEFPVQAASSATPIKTTTGVLPGPKFTRQDLEWLASKEISACFGEWFKPLDQYQRLIRMPEPPLLLADRVTGIEGQAGSMQRGSIWTETDVREDAWYLHHGRMPAGIMIEAGQADLLLISWLGLDFHNKGERVYRLLGCELSYHGELPKPGDTLCYDIHIDGHARQGDIWLFFFHYDCHINGELRLKVRNGQAGFFSEQELAESGGVLWDAAAVSYDASYPLDPPLITCEYKSFDKNQLINFAQGKLHACFGKGFEYAKCHTRTPRISQERMLFIDAITAFDPAGGPNKRGYMQAVQHISPEDWFFAGHFKNDPCMPGTLMFEAGLQVMATYMTALGYTLKRDGWRFEPVTDQTYKMQCRGQVTPASKQVVYEIFIYSVTAGPLPIIYADLLATVDGLKAFHTQIGLKLVPDWPLLQLYPAIKHHIDAKPVAEIDGFKFGYASLMACALGKPSTAFGEIYKVFDNHRRVARLPAPPYHFMTRIISIDAEIGKYKVGDKIEAEYEFAPDEWYFQQNTRPVMPFCVLLEVALQPCGWLAAFSGITLTIEHELAFRNLDGKGVLYAEVLPDSGPIRTTTVCTNISVSAGMIIESFHVECYLGEKLIYNLDTVFGFFPQAAFESQIGLPPAEPEKTALVDPSDFLVDLTTKPAAYFNNDLHLADTMLLMVDRITGFWPTGGCKGLGRLRAEKTLDPAEWFFKAHFFQDPVQPGSIGIEALIQVLQFYMLHTGLHNDIKNPQFEFLALDTELSWKYRGQVVPTDQRVNVILDIIEITKETNSVLAKANASLWVDGKRIYEAKALGMRIVTGEHPLKKNNTESWLFDPSVHSWVNDHCPNYILPTLPMMTMVDYLAAIASAQAPEKKIIALKDVQIMRWAVVQSTLAIQSEVNKLTDESCEVILYTHETGKRTPLVKGIVMFADDYPAAPLPPEPLVNPQRMAEPYYRMFHGEAFQIIETLEQGESGSSTTLTINNGKVPLGYLNQLLLDGSTHGIPHDSLTLWSKEIAPGYVGYPTLISSFELFAAPPQQGLAKCEARFAGFQDDNKRFPKFEVAILVDNHVWARYELIEILLPQGRLGSVAPDMRRAFMQHKEYVPAMGLSSYEENVTRLNVKSIKEIDWIPGSARQLYDVQSDDIITITEQIAVKEHFARQFKLHPSAIILGDKNTVSTKLQPDKFYSFNILKKDMEFIVTN